MLTRWKSEIEAEGAEAFRGHGKLTAAEEERDIIKREFGRVLARSPRRSRHGFFHRHAGMIDRDAWRERRKRGSISPCCPGSPGPRNLLPVRSVVFLLTQLLPEHL